MDDLVKLIAGTAGGAAALIAAGKWLLSDWMKRGEKLRELEKQAIQSQINDLRSVAGDLKVETKAIKLEVADLKDYMRGTELKLAKSLEVSKHLAEKGEGLFKAFEGFVENSNDRFARTDEQLKVVESKADKAIVAIGQITRIKKQGNDK